MAENTFAYEDFELEFHEQVQEVALDQWLAKAWFRMGPFMITCEQLLIDNVPSNAHWLRYNVHAIKLSNSCKKIIDKNKHFQFSIKPYKQTKELKKLYACYFADRKIDMSDNLESIIDDPKREIFNTFVILVKDQRKIIGAGIFDLGKESVAAIRNFYDPNYSQYSLGKYLILLLYQYCLQENIKWIYPGYIVPRYDKFDYKLFLDPKATEMYLYEEKLWVNYDHLLFI